MDTTFPGNALLYRRMVSPALWNAGYALIIAGEGLTGLRLCAYGGRRRSALLAVLIFVGQPDGG